MPPLSKSRPPRSACNPRISSLVFLSFQWNQLRASPYFAFDPFPHLFFSPRSACPGCHPPKDEGLSPFRNPFVFRFEPFPKSLVFFRRAGSHMTLFSITYHPPHVSQFLLTLRTAPRNECHLPFQAIFVTQESFRFCPPLPGRVCCKFVVT